MNERIKELIDKATITKTELRNGWERKTYTHQEEVFDKEKFAELIVRECANIAFDEYATTNGAESGESAILKHFGVDE